MYTCILTVNCLMCSSKNLKSWEPVLGPMKLSSHKNEAAEKLRSTEKP